MTPPPDPSRRSDGDSDSPEEADSPRDVIVDSPLWNAAPFTPGAAAAAAAQAMTAAAQELGLDDGHGWAILLADDAALRQLNLDHRGKDRPTNVLSFPAFPPMAAPPDGHLGDIAIAAETVVAESLDAGKPALHHLAHMVAHGLAHLAGHDHATDAEAEAMESIEVRALARMGLPNPYGSDSGGGHPSSNDGSRAE